MCVCVCLRLRRAWSFSVSQVWKPEQHWQRRVVVGLQVTIGLIDDANFTLIFFSHLVCVCVCVCVCVPVTLRVSSRWRNKFSTLCSASVPFSWAIPLLQRSIRADKRPEEGGGGGMKKIHEATVDAFLVSFFLNIFFPEISLAAAAGRGRRFGPTSATMTPVGRRTWLVYLEEGAVLGRSNTSDCDPPGKSVPACVRPPGLLRSRITVPFSMANRKKGIHETKMSMTVHSDRFLRVATSEAHNSH